MSMVDVISAWICRIRVAKYRAGPDGLAVLDARRYQHGAWAAWVRREAVARPRERNWALVGVGEGRAEIG